MTSFRPLLPLLLAGASCTVQAQAPSSVLGLFNALPELPASAEQATAWVDKRGQLTHPGLLALQAAIGAHKEAMGRIAAANGQTHIDQGQVVAENMNQGLLDVGIDMARMQRDPAYAQQTQERLRRMTPAEQMAMAQRMNRPLNNDRRYVNQAQAMAQDLPAARAAAEAGQPWTQAQQQRWAQQNTIWLEAENQVQRVRAKKLVAGVPKPAMEWDNIGCDKACQGAWDAYAAKMLPLMIARDTEILQIRRAAVQRHRALIAADIQTADRHLLASEFGAASRSQANQGTIVAYDGAAIAEVQALWDRVADAAKSAAVTAHCGKQIVLVPGAVCQ